VTTPVQTAEPTTAITVSDAGFEDREAIREILLTSGIFGQTDADCVDEMFVETWRAPRPDGYRWLRCVDVAGRVVGFACYGTESLTQDTWDLFWICVRPETRGMGVGRALIDAAVGRAQAEGGRLMVIYTSSTDAYAPARKLYLAAGFAQNATIPDYYKDGDSLHIYWRRLKEVSTSDAHDGGMS
jgi:ribosomal protein S18 acetylase RimI-like enzyme